MRRSRDQEAGGVVLIQSSDGGRAYSPAPVGLVFVVRRRALAVRSRGGDRTSCEARCDGWGWKDWLIRRTGGGKRVNSVSESVRGGGWVVRSHHLGWVGANYIIPRGGEYNYADFIPLPHVEILPSSYRPSPPPAPATQEGQERAARYGNRGNRRDHRLTCYNSHNHLASSSSSSIHCPSCTPLASCASLKAPITPSLSPIPSVRSPRFDLVNNGHEREGRRGSGCRSDPCDQEAQHHLAIPQPQAPANLARSPRQANTSTTRPLLLLRACQEAVRRRCAGERA